MIALGSGYHEANQDQRLIRALLSDRPVTYKPIVARALKHTEAARTHKGVTTATVFLSNLMYWDGKTKDPDGWIYKDREEVEEETALTRYEQERARAFLRATGVMEEERRGWPARMHYRVLYGPLLELLRVESERSEAKAAQKNQSDKPLQNKERDTVSPTERRHRLAIKKERQSSQLVGDTVSPTDPSGTTSGSDKQSVTSVNQSENSARQVPKEDTSTHSETSSASDGLTDQRKWEALSREVRAIPVEEIDARAIALAKEVKQHVALDDGEAARLAEYCRRRNGDRTLLAIASRATDKTIKHPWPYMLIGVLRAKLDTDPELSLQVNEPKDAKHSSPDTPGFKEGYEWFFE